MRKNRDDVLYGDASSESDGSCESSDDDGGSDDDGSETYNPENSSLEAPASDVPRAAPRTLRRAAPPAKRAAPPAKRAAIAPAPAPAQWAVALCEHTQSAFLLEMYERLRPFCDGAPATPFVFSCVPSAAMRPWARALLATLLGAAARVECGDAGVRVFILDVGAAQRALRVLDENRDATRFALPAGAWRRVYEARARAAARESLATVRAWCEVAPACAESAPTLGERAAAARVALEARASLAQLAAFLDGAAAQPGSYVPRYGACDAPALQRAAAAVRALRDDVVGQHGVKCALARFVAAHVEWRNSESDVANNFIMYGPPGVGKTTVARLVAQIFVALRFFDPPEPRTLVDIYTDLYRKVGHAPDEKGAQEAATLEAEALETYGKAFAAGAFRETNRAGFVGGFAGTTALKTTETVMSALGGALLFDEGYNLALAPQDFFGIEAAGQLVALMTRVGRSMSVIVAGQEDAFRSKLFSVNPGIESRFPNILRFTTYNAAECTKIFMLRLLEPGTARFECTPPMRTSARALESERVWLTAFFARPAVVASLADENARGLATLVDLATKEARARARGAASLADAHARALAGAHCDVVSDDDVERAFRTFANAA
jgi:DNA polymerase III delta prime subunit